MSRKAPIIPVDARMYRHFAIATVLITGCLAMFASGENREALADTIEAQQRKVEMEQAQAQAKKPAAKKSNFTDKRKVKGSFGSDADLRWDPPAKARSSSGYAMSSDAELVAAPDVTFAGSGSAPPPAMVGPPPPPGISLVESGQMANQKKKKQAPPASRKPTQQEIEAMMAASDARSQTRRD